MEASSQGVEGDLVKSCTDPIDNDTEEVLEKSTQSLQHVEPMKEVRMEDSGEELKSKPPPYAYVETNETKPLLKSNMDASTNGMGSIHQSLNSVKSEETRPSSRSTKYRKRSTSAGNKKFNRISMLIADYREEETSVRRKSMTPFEAKKSAGVQTSMFSLYRRDELWMAWTSSIHIPLLFLVQILFIILFGCFVRYDPKNAMRNNFDDKDNVKDSHAMHVRVYSMFQDVHVMIFIGFGFLMTFLKKYGLSAVSLNFLISALCIQWSILMQGWLHPHCENPEEKWGECPDSQPWIDLNTVSLISADFATATVLISFGVVLGTTNPAQLAIMAFIEIILFNVNEWIGRNMLSAVDAGDTIFVHMFGAYFGLACSFMLYNKKAAESEKAGPSHISDLFSMIGTVFLWMFWPSFNAGAAAEGDAQMRAVMNTYLSLCGCVLTSFATSAFFSPTRKFSMEHIQNATLAGGVAVGATADMMITPVGALIIGSFAGILSTWGYAKLTPLLAERCRLLDTCGVNNLHGMPSLLGGLLSILMAGIATRKQYDFYNGEASDSFHEIFFGLAEDGRDAAWQAGMQAAAMGITLAIAIPGGLATGLIMRFVGAFSANKENRENRVSSKFGLSYSDLYDDNGYFHVEDDESA